MAPDGISPGLGLTSRTCSLSASFLLTHWGRHFPDDTFKRIFLNENIIISIKISLKFVPKGPINNIPALVQIMAWCRPGGKPLSEAIMVSLLTHICVTRPQWVHTPGPLFAKRTGVLPQEIVSKLRGWMLQWPYRSEIRQASRQRCCLSNFRAIGKV